ncbi:hypothetical protein J2Z42_002021 [Clostridium algifaecis]|uniref:Uncharacterized protein n=1 Tax=Clostridium algifaecis TaxID=1472040 RepID=A0ABS4KTC9_9CLOT|nr:hypothetical protein [Clostridium algifaecis]
MYKNKVQKKHKNNTKNTNLVQRLKATERYINRFRLEFYSLEDRLLNCNSLMEGRIEFIEEKIGIEPF